MALSRAGVARNFGYELVVGSRLPLVTGGGKALLSQLDEEAFEQAYASTSDDEDQMPDHDALIRDIVEIRRRGYSISLKEREPGVASVAAAVPAEYGVLAAIQVTGTLDDFPEEKTQSMGRQVRQAAIAIGHGLPELWDR